MIDREDARRLLRLSKIDLKAARNMLDPSRFDDTVFGFHAQQAVEKALKAWLSLKSIAYPKTHDLRLLLRLLESRGEEYPEDLAHLVDLTDFAVQFRYDFPGLPEGLNRAVVLHRVETLVCHVEQILKEPDTFQ